jgi:hypothetical protein
MRHLLLALLLTAPAAHADILPNGHAKVRHTFEVRGLEDAPEGTRFFAYPTDMSGGSQRITSGTPFSWYKFANPRIYATQSETWPDFAGDDAELGLPVSDGSFDLVSSVPERRATREIRTVYAFKGIEGDRVILELLSETHFDGDGNQVAPGAIRGLRLAWFLLPALAAAGLVLLARRRSRP